MKFFKASKIVTSMAAATLVLATASTILVANAYVQKGGGEFNPSTSFHVEGTAKELVWNNEYCPPTGSGTEIYSYSRAGFLISGNETGKTYVRVSSYNAEDKKETKNHYKNDECANDNIHSSSKVYSAKTFASSMNLSSTLYKDGNAYQQDNYWTAK